MSERVDAIVIGAGVVGLAVARSLALSGKEVIIIEADKAIGMGTSSRNSEVIHAGIYYAKDSLKAKLCVKGKEMLYDFCDSHGVTYNKELVLETGFRRNEVHESALRRNLGLVMGVRKLRLKVPEVRDEWQR